MRSSREEGFLFLDILVALFIVSAAAVTIYVNISLAAISASRIDQKVIHLITERNTHALERRIIYAPPQE